MESRDWEAEIRSEMENFLTTNVKEIAFFASWKIPFNDYEYLLLVSVIFRNILAKKALFLDW